MRKINIAIAASVLMVLFIKGFSSFLSSGYGMSGLIILVACIMPVLFIYAMSQQSRWLGILIGGVAWQYTIPIVFLHGIEIGILMTLGVCALLVVHTAQLGRSWFSVFDGWQSRLMGLITVGIFLRILANPPGSVHAGGVGGAREAGVFLLGGIAFFVPKFLFDSKPDMAVTRKTVIYTILGALVLHLAATFPAGVGYGFRRLFVRSMWFLCAYALASVADRSWRFGVSGLQNWLVMGLTLLLGSLSAHRSRILFAAGLVGVASYVYGRLSRNAMLVVSLIVVCGLVLGATGMDLPAPVARPLSVVFPQHASKAEEYIRANALSEETGWSSPFRGVLMRMAGNSIRRHPLVGKGFTFSTTEYWVAYHKRNTMEGKYQVLAATGAYHNSLVELAVACGLPIVFLFCIVYAGVVVPFVKRLRKAACSDTRILFTAMLGLFVAESGQVLMNGGSQDFYIISMLLGVMHYSRGILASAPADDDEESSPAEELPVVRGYAL